MRRKLSTLLVVASLPLGFTPNSIAQGPIAGSRCSVPGKIQVSGEYKFICVNSAGKLTWTRSSSATNNPESSKVSTSIQQQKKLATFSLRANLPKSAYSSLACDPFDSRISDLPLPNGVGPEARAAAACLALELKKNSNLAADNISVYLSPDLPNWFSDIYRKPIAAAEKIWINKYGSNNLKYIVLVSTDADWLCTKGKELLDPLIQETISGGFRNVMANLPIKGFAGLADSGCPGAEITNRVRPYILGKNLDYGVVFRLLKKNYVPKKSDINTVGTQIWWDQAISHEFSHVTMAKRGSSWPNGFAEPGWYGEGQADYLGWMSNSFAFNNYQVRDIELEELRQSMQRAGIKRVSIDDTPTASDNQMIYTAGFFAYEYLVAHYGLEKTWKIWDTWGTFPCNENNRRNCWKLSVKQELGLSAIQLSARLDRYINEQIQSSKTCNPLAKKGAYKELGTALTSTGLNAALCIADYWSKSKAPKIAINFYGYPVSENYREAQRKMVEAGFRLTYTIPKNPGASVGIIYANTPEISCKSLKQIAAGSPEYEWILQQPWSGCLTNPPNAPHTWANWDANKCNNPNANGVNLGFLLSGGPNAGVRFNLFSRCTENLKNAGSDLGVIRKSIQESLLTLSNGGRRYWFESGFQNLIATYGGALATGNQVSYYGIPNINYGKILAEDTESAMFMAQRPYLSVGEFEDNGNGAIPWQVHNVFGVLAAEYVIGSYGLQPAIDLMKGWQISSGPQTRIDVTQKVLGISEEQFIADVDAYIYSALSQTF